jgi:hypothetical protein
MAWEAAPADGRCGPAEVYLADALFIEGARPDVVAAYPSYPRSRQAGWGVMVLTNMLPNQGNGTFWFFVHARDAEGHTSRLGMRTMTCDNAYATLPFGTIDTPVQGETVSARYMSTSGGRSPRTEVDCHRRVDLTAFVDGIPVGHQADHYRVDIATLFPGWRTAMARWASRCPTRPPIQRAPPSSDGQDSASQTGDWAVVISIVCRTARRP